MVGAGKSEILLALSDEIRTNSRVPEGASVFSGDGFGGAYDLAIMGGVMPSR